MTSKTKKATFSLHKEVLDALDEAMDKGAAPSKNALVEQALIRELGDLRRQARKALWQEAAKDPLFLKDLHEVEADFSEADAQTARRIA